ncbi:MAG: diguanylate cyclase [Leptospiraceae bacterium]|nr:diguanylate cyclase [Leptospiraceae bacterium]
MQKILIVDDSEVTILYLKNILKEYEIFSANNGKEMWERLNESIPSLILMDIMLPGDSGYELVRKLSNIELYKDIPIIFQTAKSSSDDLEKGFESGAIDYIRKPVDKKELVARIKSVLKIKALEKQLYLKSVTDYLTEIYNRRYFFEVAAKHLQFCQNNNKNLSIALIDIDHFKKVNDTYGHDAGDFVLKRFSEIITEKKRENDILARYGGEEFIILFQESDISIALEILTSVQTAMTHEVFKIGNKEFGCTFSCGIIELSEMKNISTLDDLIRNADNRMYIAKNSGRNRIITNG